MHEQNDSGRGVRIGNFSGFYGDRSDSINELLDAGVDYLTGDYLAELTMLILRKNQMAGRPAYAAGFISQLRPVLGRIAEQGVKVVCNAGGLDPLGCAQAIRELCADLGVSLTVAAISGDDLLDQLPRLIAESNDLLANLDTSASFEVPADEVLAANAYLGAWPIVRALERGADIVICPRVTDASLVIGPAAHHFGWSPGDYNRLAGALWAGHAIECGGQVTGGNYSFFHEEGPLGIPPMPVAEIFEDGTSIITKSVAETGLVSTDTLTAQLLYEVSGPLYYNPDVIGDLRTVRVTQVGDDAVRLSGAVGYAPTTTAKLSVCFEGGYRNSITIGLTGGHLEQKLEWLRTQVDQVLTHADEFDGYRWTVVGPRDPSNGGIDDATALAIITARSSKAEAVGRRAFTGAITQLGVSSIPGCYFVGPPQAERSAAVQWPALVDKTRITAVVHLPGQDDEVVEWPEVSIAQPVIPIHVPEPPRIHDATAATIDVCLGDLFGTRSGDKAGLANVGVWARDDQAYAWLLGYLTVERFRLLVPDAAGLRIDRHAIPGVHGINFVIHEFLEQGTASSTLVDSQAKGLGEYVASRKIQVPAFLLGRSAEEDPRAVSVGTLDIGQRSAITG
ncbi:acyclic terpene utilization AtuA family protein [Rhodococcus sp. 14C212]|uniref:acyclic terpene utilization AtuA family protein n=1 Tax=Rhodococcus sp. 14C212 TaxID=2711209 RepID=UPI003211EA5D